MAEKTPITTEALLAGVAVQATNLVDISEALLKQIRLSRLERGFFAVIFLLIVAVLGGLVFLAVANRQNTVETKKVSQLVLDCTQSGGACYERGLKQQAVAVAGLVQANLAADWCSTHSRTFDLARECVARLIQVPHKG